MNMIKLKGMILDHIKVSIVKLEGTEVLVGKFVIGYRDEKTNSVECFECIAFDDVARDVRNSFKIKSKITVEGILKNFKFEDANYTRHYTNVICVSSVAKDISDITETELNDAEVDMSVLLHYKELCENGYLCINEDDYYDIVTSNYTI